MRLVERKRRRGRRGEKAPFQRKIPNRIIPASAPAAGAVEQRGSGV